MPPSQPTPRVCLRMRVSLLLIQTTLLFLRVLFIMVVIRSSSRLLRFVSRAGRSPRTLVVSVRLAGVLRTWIPSDSESCGERHKRNIEINQKAAALGWSLPAAHVFLFSASSLVIPKSPSQQYSGREVSSHTEVGCVPFVGVINVFCMSRVLFDVSGFPQQLSIYRRTVLEN